MASTRERVLSIARGELGTGERSDGTSKYGSWYARLKNSPAFADAPWCEMFVSWVANEAGVPDSVIPRMAYTPYAAQWFKGCGRYSQTPHAGDIVWFDWGGTRNIAAIDHVGFVESVMKDGRVVTIEGNSADRVMRRVRSRSTIAGFGHPAYPNTPAKPEAPTKPAKPKPLNATEAIVKQLPMLRRGAKGFDVKTLFYLLHARGYGINGGNDDTVFGEALEQALISFQKAAKLKPDGVCGPLTWPALLRVA